ncbi:TPA: hypothetical protein ACTBC1_004503 [Yersinia enterocolitica]|uniref:Uncharacterized protein n=1 Tax=Yersinia intermedia TaxID=631 RepID=A0A0T9LRW8_YERIN|nr:MULTISPECIES: hypothetical protein [Yersinia]MDN0096601.1 hypothetical protein [Yersinia rohdei]CNF18676.1 Uncharacterised protein [Yersinia intermedia]
MKAIIQVRIQSILMTKEEVIISGENGEEHKFHTNEFSWAHSIKPGMIYTKWDTGNQTLTVEEDSHQ